MKTEASIQLYCGGPGSGRRPYGKMTHEDLFKIPKGWNLENQHKWSGIHYNSEVSPRDIRLAKMMIKTAVKKGDRKYEKYARNMLNELQKGNTNQYKLALALVPISKLKSAQTKDSSPSKEMEKVFERGKKLEPTTVTLNKGKYNVEDGNTRIRALQNLGYKGNILTTIAYRKDKELKGIKIVSMK